MGPRVRGDNEEEQARPAYVVTDSEGRFAFKHLAPGKYKLKAWSERSKGPIPRHLIWNYTGPPPRRVPGKK